MRSKNKKLRLLPERWLFWPFAIHGAKKKTEGKDNNRNDHRLGKKIVMQCEGDHGKRAEKRKSGSDLF